MPLPSAAATTALPPGSGLVSAGRGSFSLLRVRHFRMTFADIALAFAIAACLDLVLSFHLVSPVLHGDLVSPDSYMRLVRIREGLSHGSLGHVVSADGSGFGTVLHWTRFLDALILALAAPLMLISTQDWALHLAGAAVGPLGMGLLGVAAAWAAAPVADRAWLWTAPLLVGLSNVLGGYGAFGYADHHILLVVAVVVTAGAAARAACGDASAGTVGGIAAATGIWISPETMPFDLMAFAAMVIGWSAAPASVGPVLRRFAGAWLAVIAVALFVDPPMAGYRAAEIDRLSSVYLVMAALLFAVACVLRPVERIRRPVIRLGTGIVIGAVGFALWIVLYPTVLGGPDALMPAEIRHVFFDRIEEMKRITAFGDVALYLGTGMFATAIAGILAVRNRSLLWCYGALAGAATVLIGGLHLRFATYSAGMGALMLPIGLTSIGRWAESLPSAHNRAAFAVNSRQRLPGLLRMAVLAFFLLAPSLPAALSSPADAAERAAAGPSCALNGIERLLAPYPGAVVLTSADDAPEVLYRAPVKTVGSLYHRNLAAFMRLRAAWISGPSATVPPEIRATHASLVLFCPTGKATTASAERPGEALADRLNRGDVPTWLTLVGADPGSGQLLYSLQ